jgi:hypothetical protein
MISRRNGSGQPVIAYKKKTSEFGSSSAKVRLTLIRASLNVVRIRLGFWLASLDDGKK